MFYWYATKLSKIIDHDGSLCHAQVNINIKELKEFKMLHNRTPDGTVYEYSHFIIFHFTKINDWGHKEYKENEFISEYQHHK